MKYFKDTPLEGVFIYEPPVFKDKRGSFTESFNQRHFEEIGINDIRFVQDNRSVSQKNTLRGLHFQKGEFSQAKLISVQKGRIVDIVVDLRKKSPTFLKHYKIELNENGGQSLYVPRGFAHGFLALENNTEIFYKCDNFYNKNADGGVFYADKDLGIEWGIDESSLILSVKDKELPSLQEIEYF